MAERTAIAVLKFIGPFDESNLNDTPALKTIREAVNDMVNAGYVLDVATALVAGDVVDLSINPA